MSYMGTRGNIGESGAAARPGDSMRRVWGGIEGGGRKFVCLIGPGPDELLATETIPTTDPQQTLGAAARFFERHGADTSLASLGIACFGPIDLNPASPRYGSITTTPKPGWANVDVLGYFTRRLGLPVGWDTDVNGAALAEQRCGAARGLDSLVYFTVGPGIGGSAPARGQPGHPLPRPALSPTPPHPRPP